MRRLSATGLANMVKLFPGCPPLESVTIAGDAITVVAEDGRASLVRCFDMQSTADLISALRDAVWRVASMPLLTPPMRPRAQCTSFRPGRSRVRLSVTVPPLPYMRAVTLFQEPSLREEHTSPEQAEQLTREQRLGPFPEEIKQRAW